jgi:hypothetical protein
VALRALETLGALPFVLPELPALKGTIQPPPHQYDVWNHTLAVMAFLEEILETLAPGFEPGTGGDYYTGLLAMKLGRYRDRFDGHQTAPRNHERSHRSLLFFAALYHDVAKPECKTLDDQDRIHFYGHDKRGAEIAASRAQSLHLSNDEIERLRSIIHHHMRLSFHGRRLREDGKPPSRKAIYRFFRDTGEAGVDLTLLALADTRATRVHTLTQEHWTSILDTCRIFLENYWEKPQESVSPPALLDGHEVMRAFDLDPGPRVGLVMEAIMEGQATGKVSSREEALQYGRQWLEAHP